MTRLLIAIFLGGGTGSVIGTSHGAYKFTPEQCHIDPATGRMVPPPLAFEVLDAVMEKLPGFPIVSNVKP